MARQVLENGVILPAEYSDDWYDDMTSNLTKLDDVIGSDSEKLSSADVGAAALSNNYNDLDNLPTIPTVNDATLTIQKNGVDVQTFTANASSNVTANITVPTKTSDLTNDSNFVDTSNAAVSSGITSSKVTDYDTHIADTDIHVTTTDKNRWNNQTYVFRYSSTALTASSTNSNALLDNTDNLKVGDKVIDSSGVLFSITAIDTQNSTFTIGTALLDLAQDSDVVHKSGDETVGGKKTFTNEITNNINKTNATITLKNSSYDPKTNGQSNVNSGSFSIGFNTLTDDSFAWISAYGLTDYTMLRLTTTYFTDSENSITDSIEYKIYQNGDRTLRPRNNNNTTLGETNRRWSKIYGTEYYYGSNNVEFSTKFVTTDTAQTISGAKTYSSDLFVANTDTTANTPNLSLRNYKVDRGTNDTGVQTITFLDKNAKALTLIESRKISNGNVGTNILCYNTDDNNNTVSGGVSIIKSKTDTHFAPSTDNAVTCGRPLAKWSDVQTYKVNALEPSSLSLPATTGTIDISSYITDLTGVYVNTYTPPANGYIVITCNSNDVDYIKVSNNLNFVSVVDNTNNQFTSGILGVWQPCVTGVGIQIRIKASALNSAKFIPCQGNV